MIIFKKLRYKNFLSTGNFFTEITLNEHNTTLIVGENGSGKSTILDALSFSLFGRAFRKINKPQLINSITNKDLVVEVEFDIGNNKYKIVRGIKPNIFEVYQNGSLLNQTAESKDYQEILEKQILKVNHKSFSQVVVLGSATFQPFMQLPAGQRREIIEDLLDLQIFTKMNFLLKNKILINTDALTACNNNKKIADEKIKLIKQHILETKNNNEQIIEEKKQRIVQTNEQIDELNNKYWKIKGDIDLLKEKTENEQSLSKKLSKLTELKHQIEVKLNNLKKEVDFFNKHDNCPTCKQTIDKTFKCETVDKKEKEISEINGGLALLIQQYNELNEKIKAIMDINSQINDLRIEERSYNTKINSMIEYRDNLEEEIKNINKIRKTENEDKISDLENDLKAIEQQYNSLIEEREILTIAGSLLKDEGIKSKIIRQYIPIINKLINKYLSAIEFMCNFELDENFNETIKSRYRDIFSYSSFSEGEKMRINLAILFTWRAVAKLRNSINTNLLIMDEVFDSSLDANGTEEFMKILNNLTIDTNTFIISHKTDQLFDKFKKVIKFEKHKNFSKIVS